MAGVDLEQTLMPQTMQRWVAAFDIHGDMQDAKANRVLFEFCRDFKPHIRICGGDVFDFRAMRRKATAEEREDSMRADFDLGCEWLAKFKPQYWTRGNHDERLYDFAAHSHGIIQDAALTGIAKLEALTKKLGCRMLPYDRRAGVLRIGKLKVLHGYHAGAAAARQHALIYGSCLFGHVHTIDESAVPGLDRRVARSCGCLCKLDMDYNRHQTGTLRWAHGFAYGWLDTNTGVYKAEQAEEINGKWVLSHEYKTYQS